MAHISQNVPGLKNQIALSFLWTTTKKLICVFPKVSKIHQEYGRVGLFEYISDLLFLLKLVKLVLVLPLKDLQILRL